MPLNSPSAAEPGPCLFVVATPIGHLADITLRAIDTLSRADLVAAEDTRHARRLFAAHGIKNKLISYHDHNERQRTPELVRMLEQGRRIALVSNAGTPLVSDPGYRLIAAAAQRCIPIIPIPGVSAVTTALSVCGLPTDAFTFVGFPLRKKNKRLQQLLGLSHLHHTLVFYQSPSRIGLFLGELIQVMGDRSAVLAREMTKIHEEFIRGCLSQISARLNQRNEVKGECTLLVHGAAPADSMEPADLEKTLRAAMSQTGLPLAQVVKSIAAEMGISKKSVYDLALKIRKEPGS